MSEIRYTMNKVPHTKFEPKKPFHHHLLVGRPKWQEGSIFLLENHHRCLYLLSEPMHLQGTKMTHQYPRHHRNSRANHQPIEMPSLNTTHTSAEPIQLTPKGKQASEEPQFESHRHWLWHHLPHMQQQKERQSLLRSIRSTLSRRKFEDLLPQDSKQKKK